MTRRLLSPRLAAVFVLAAIPAISLAANCAAGTTGFTPLNDPFSSIYQGVPGGLYPDGAVRRPAAHEAAGLELSAQVVPRGPGGAPDPASGRIVLLSIGMSNTTQEFSVFKKIADPDPDRNPRLAIIDGAQGGWSADRIVANGTQFWATLDNRLAAAGVTAAQVQVAWMKEADARPTLPFPDHARRLQSEMLAISQTLRQRFPNLRQLYLSSRTYAGYASSALNPEPYAYESGFAVRWLIEQQIKGDSELSYRDGRAPWLSWGPYLWGDGTNPREDGLIWNCEDFQPSDGTHPSDSGRQKVAAMLLNFFKTDATARPWFVRPPSQTPPQPQPEAAVNAASYGKGLAAGSAVALFGAGLASRTESAQGTPFPTVLADTMVKVAGEPALLYYVSPSQINWVMPKAPAASELTVVREGVESAPLPFALALYAPGIFTLNGYPDGPAAALDAANRVILSANPASRGSTVQLFLTGLGRRNPLLKMPEFPPIVQIGGVTSEVSYYGPSPGSPGLDQINFKVPPSAPTGPAVPLIVQLHDSAGNPVTLPVQ